MVFCSSACTQASAVAWCLFLKPRHSSVIYISHYPSILHASQLVHPLCASGRVPYSCPVCRCPDVHVGCAMLCHYLSCRCLGNHNGSGRPHHSDISIHTCYTILACQPQVMHANTLQVIVRVSESAPKRCKAQSMSAQTAVKRPTADTCYCFAAQLC